MVLRFLALLYDTKEYNRCADREEEQRRSFVAAFGAITSFATGCGKQRITFWLTASFRWWLSLPS